VCSLRINLLGQHTYTPGTATRAVLFHSQGLDGIGARGAPGRERAGGRGHLCRAERWFQCAELRTAGAAGTGGVELSRGALRRAWGTPGPKLDPAVENPTNGPALEAKSPPIGLPAESAETSTVVRGMHGVATGQTRVWYTCCPVTPGRRLAKEVNTTPALEAEGWELSPCPG